MARIADRHYVRWDILGYDRPGTDGYVVADGDPRKNSDAAADPYVIADGDRLRPLVAGVPFDWVSAMAGCIDAYVPASFIFSQAISMPFTLPEITT